MTKRVLVISTVAAFVVLALIYFVFWPWPEPGEDGLDDPEITQPERAPEGAPLTEPPASQAPPTQQ